MARVAGAGCTFVDPTSGAREDIRYLDVGDCGGQLYSVHHHAQGRRRGGVVLCGPIGAERERSYRTLVDIARTVAAAGFDALRFDYRGIGESTGRFEDYCLSDWRQDVEICARQIRERCPNQAIGLWGVRAGALLASEAFGAGLADGAMLCAPMDGQPLLRDILRRTLVADMLARPRGKRSTREEIVTSLECGAVVNVDGYAWSRRLWQDAATHRVVVPADDLRPWQVVDFTGLPKTVFDHHVVSRRQVNSAGRFWESSPALVPKDMSLAASTVTWLDSLMRGVPA
jgi:pimeloyl-ACP methyl ester carboxylesterase